MTAAWRRRRTNSAVHLLVDSIELTRMSMHHKAFRFDWMAFHEELLPILERALAEEDGAPLRTFIDAHRATLVDPYEGLPLPEGWPDLLETGDVQELGDFALTRFYDPTQDSGLGPAWLQLSDALPPEAGGALLGRAIGPDDNLFDPGRMGSYFQSPAEVRLSVAALGSVEAPELRDFRRLLEACVSAGHGLYVTF